MGRIIGISHRIKRTAAGEARPTRVCIHELATGDRRLFELEDETAELDFLRGRLPVSYRPVHEDEDLDLFFPHHVKTKSVDGVDIPHRVPDAYEGLQAGDTVVMFSGGSGDRLAFAAAVNGRPLDVPVMRIATFGLEKSEDKDPQHHIRLVEAYLSNPKKFHLTTPRDLEIIKVREFYQQRTDALKARMACGQRLRQRAIGTIFFTPDGGYPAGRVEDAFDAILANDKIYAALESEERRRNTDLEKAVRDLPVWTEVMSQVEGLGVTIAAGLIASVGDIRRFTTDEELGQINELRRRIQMLEAQAERNKHLKAVVFEDSDNHFLRNAKIRQHLLKLGETEAAAKLQLANELMQQVTAINNKGKGRFKAFCGVHCINGWLRCTDCNHAFKLDESGNGTGCPKCGSQAIENKPIFARRRTGVVANWHPIARQSFYQLGEQFTRRPNSVWGKKQRAQKAAYREKHPTAVKHNGSSRYSDGHIHRMATWRTITRFAEWLYDAWMRVETRIEVESNQ